MTTLQYSGNLEDTPTSQCRTLAPANNTGV
jgi:hypothetical protein